MQVGLATIFQNPGRHRSDREVYREELALADLAEPLGFDSLWGVEHHFTDYTMCPDVLQFLAYMAGRTTRVRLGSMVVVNYAGMPHEEAERSMRLFAAEVAPALRPVPGRLEPAGQAAR